MFDGHAAQSMSNVAGHLEQRLGRVLDTHGLLCGALVDASGEVIVRSGAFESLQDVGLVSSLLGPDGSAKATFDSLEGQLLPQIYAQGENFALVDKVHRDLLIVLFGRGGGDAVAQYHLSKVVSATVATLFGAR